MGRHSAPDDDADATLPPPVRAPRPLPYAGPAGRHSRGDGWPVPGGAREAVAEDVHSAETDVLPVLRPAPVGKATAPAPKASPEPAAEPAAEPSPEPSAEPSPEPSSEPSPEPGSAARETSTHADLRMLRENPALRARCAAGVVVPFVLYIAVLVVVGQLSLFLLWVWIPTVSAGVIVGSFLDAAHHRARRNASR